MATIHQDNQPKSPRFSRAASRKLILRMSKMTPDLQHITNPVPEEKISCEMDLKIPQDNIHKKMENVKVIKIPKKKIRTPFMKVGFAYGNVISQKSNLREWLLDSGEQFMPVKMKSISGPLGKIPVNQVGNNGKPFPGWKDEGKQPNNDDFQGYWAKPTDFTTLSEEQIKARSSELAWKDKRCRGAHSCSKLMWIDVDTEFCDGIIKKLLKKCPHYPSTSNPIYGGNKAGRFHIPVLTENWPDEFPEDFMGCGPKTKSKCYYTDLISEEADKDKTKIEIYSGGWLYFNTNAEMINHNKPIATLNFTKFKDYIRRKPIKSQNNKKKKSVIKHKIKDKVINKKQLEKFKQYSRLITEEVWDRTKGRMDRGGNWNLIMNAAKWEGMKWEDWDNLCQEFPNKYDYDKNKIKWDKLIQAECFQTDLNLVRGMAKGWKNDEGEPQGNWKEFAELDSHFTQSEKFCRFRFNKFAVEATELLDAEMNGEVEEVDELQDAIETLEDEKKSCKDRKRKKQIREEIKELRAEIQEVKEQDDDGNKLAAILNDCYKKCKIYFEKFHFKLKFPKPGFAISNKTDIYFISCADLKELYQNVSIPVFDKKQGYKMKSWIEIWVKDLHIHTLDNCDFLPPPLERDYDTFNMFRGLAGGRIGDSVEAVSKEEMLDIFGEHLKIIVGGEDPHYINKETALAPYEYMMMTLAHMVQKPGEISEVAPVIVGQQGTGKSVFVSLLCEKVLGKEYLLKTSNINDIVGTFSRIDRKLMVMLEEASGKATFGESNKVKDLITEPRVRWEQKYKDGLTINNCATYWFLSNDRTPVKIELGDRRFVVFVCSPRWKQASIQERTEYFNRLVAAFNDPCYVKAFYQYLLNYDLTLPKYLQPEGDKNGKKQFHPKNNRPFTERYCDIQSVNVPKPYYFFNNYVEMSGINHINAGDDEETPELYKTECERIAWEKTHLKKQNGEEIACNKWKSDSRADIYCMYESYLECLGMSAQKEFIDATKFWRKIREWCEDKEGKWGKAISLETDENGVNICVVKPIEMRECLEEFIHLLIV